MECRGSARKEKILRPNEGALPCLRHEATSKLFEKDSNPMEVAEITGHKTSQMLKRYTHLQRHSVMSQGALRDFARVDGGTVERTDEADPEANHARCLHCT